VAKHSDTAILILAAGESRRLGRPKQLLTFQGETLIRRIARRASESKASMVLVVLGHQAESVQKELTGLDKLRTIHNPDYQLGMGTSIRTGVQALASHAAVLISVCDQPHLTTAIFDQLIARLPESPAGIVCSRYTGSTHDSLPTVHGVPAIFTREHYAALTALPDDAGAKSLLSENDVDSIDFTDGALDIDTLEDLANI
jgi:molybdenum cofactor cytidylyltransferase